MVRKKKTQKGEQNVARGRGFAKKDASLTGIKAKR